MERIAALEKELNVGSWSRAMMIMIPLLTISFKRRSGARGYCFKLWCSKAAQEPPTKEVGHLGQYRSIHGEL